MVTNKELFNARAYLDGILAKHLPLSEVRAFVKLIKPITQAIAEVYEQRERMIAYHHATLSPDGRQFLFTDEARPKFYVEWDTFAQKESSVRFAPLPDEWIEKLGLNVGEVAALEFMFAGE